MHVGGAERQFVPPDMTASVGAGYPNHHHATPSRRRGLLVDNVLHVDKVPRLLPYRVKVS